MARYDRRNALILGAGRSGRAAGRLILELQGRVTVADEAWTSEALASFGSEGMSCVRATREHLPDGNYDLVVVSPSIPLTHPWITKARARGLAIISELELGSVYWRGEIIAVTGSKGKSSVIKCLTDTLTLAGRRAVTAGNFGIPLCERLLECPDFGAGTIAVTEVSSFQLEHTRTFSPRLAAILNIQPDHLDRHGTMEAYLAAKRRIFQAVKPQVGRVFLPWGISPLGIPQGVPLLRFGPQPWVDWRFHKGVVTHGSLSIPVEGVFNNPILGDAASLIAGMLTELGLTPEQIAQGFATYQPLPHRFQCLGKLNGVSFIDDSKATSLTATQAALKMVGHDARLIAGGLLKEEDLDFLEEELAIHAVKAYLIGAAQESLEAAWRDILPCEKCGTLETAVRKAFAESLPGDTILLSPGAASFDQYAGMSARGEDFARCFRALAEATPAPQP